MEKERMHPNLLEMPFDSNAIDKNFKNISKTNAIAQVVHFLPSSELCLNIHAVELRASCDSTQ